MTTSQADSLEGGALPLLSLAQSGGSPSLVEMARKVEKTLAGHEIRLKPQDPIPEIADFVKLYTTRLPDPLDPDMGEVDYVVVVAANAWTPERTDAFIAAMAPQRLRKGMPLFHFYGDCPRPPEIAFLFETMLAGIFEMMAWEQIEDPHLDSQDCLDLAEFGRAMLSDLYDVNLEPDDLQWLSVVNQLIIEELRWFDDDPKGRLDPDVDYIPHASLMILGCVAGEAVRLNHTSELVWTDADGLDWPRLGRLGASSSLPIIDTVFQRFEQGNSADLWQSYEQLFASGRLSPPVSLGSEVNPLDFLPAWDPEPDLPLDEAVATFKDLCQQRNLSLEPHPTPEDDLLARHLVGFSIYHDDQCYDLFLCTSPWDEALTEAFLRFYGHRSFEDWEVGLSPVFVFFSGHPLSPLLEYCFVQGPPSAPLEGIARVETPAPFVPANASAPDMIALWLAQSLELYTTIGLDLGSPSVLPGLEFFVREELRFTPELVDEAEALLDDEGANFEPLALLVAIGMTAGSALVIENPRRQWRWTEGASWPLLQIDGDRSVDLVEQARAIWRGEVDEFKI